MGTQENLALLKIQYIEYKHWSSDLIVWYRWARKHNKTSACYQEPNKVTGIQKIWNKTIPMKSCIGSVLWLVFSVLVFSWCNLALSVTQFGWCLTDGCVKGIILHCAKFLCARCSVALSYVYGLTHPTEYRWLCEGYHLTLCQIIVCKV